MVVTVRKPTKKQVIKYLEEIREGVKKHWTTGTMQHYDYNDKTVRRCLVGELRGVVIGDANKGCWNEPRSVPVLDALFDALPKGFRAKELRDLWEMDEEDVNDLDAVTKEDILIGFNDSSVNERRIIALINRAIRNLEREAA